MLTISRKRKKTSHRRQNLQILTVSRKRLTVFCFVFFFILFYRNGKGLTIRHISYHSIETLCNKTEKDFKDSVNVK